MSNVRRSMTLGVLAALLVIAFVISLGSGAVSIAPAQVVSILLSRLGIETAVAFAPQQEAVLTAIRLPRALLSIFVGAGLAVAGAAFQGAFRNPLADPVLLGIASGAVVGAVLVHAFSFTTWGVWSVPLVAFAGALLPTLALLRFAKLQGKTDVTTLILAGVALNLFLGSVVTMITAMARTPGLRDATFWTLGGLGGTLWPHVYVTAPVLLLAALYMWRLGPQLNLLLLGDADAEHLGVDAQRLRLHVSLVATLVTATAVAFAGNVAFIGLVVPHALRRLLGPDHRVLLPASLLGGGALLCFADLTARTLIAPAELPVGVLTTLVGGPLFFYLLGRARREGGW
ncbi:MAG: iron ABC transporter permease [Firmicutes bacterium]|nr:iron ABC transporter permease [Bacillota bacterium]